MIAYKGHGAATGGLQAHSVGELYPLDVYGQETAEGTRYGVIDLSTGAETGAQWSIAEATLIARIIRGTGRTPPARDDRTSDIERLAALKRCTPC